MKISFPIRATARRFASCAVIGYVKINETAIAQQARAERTSRRCPVIDRSLGSAAPGWASPRRNTLSLA